MRLLERSSAGEIHLTRDLLDHEIPRYAILSHTWGAEEVLFHDLTDKCGMGKKKQGYKKIRFCADQAWRDGLQFCWVDTCCIDKPNNTELQEAINSMFRWYQDAAKCYVYLADVSVPAGDGVDKSTWEQAFQQSRWFTRGWTLQELIAPVSVEFFSREGVPLGTRKSLEHDIHRITGLPRAVLQGISPSGFSISERLAWVEKRETTRKEDKAYSLLGLFGISMALIYGEGEANAFRRLLAEVEQTTRFEVGKRRFEETTKGGNEDSYNAAHQSSGLSHPSKRRKPAFLSSEELSPTDPIGETRDSIGSSVTDLLVDQLFFSQIDERLTSLTAAQGKTCRWFLSKPEYVTWRHLARQSEDGNFLWIKGNPGTGKSTLMKLLFEEAKLSTNDDPSQIILSFFFLARGTLEEKSITGLYRSLLHQLFEKAVDLRECLGWMTADGARGILQNGWHEQALKHTLTSAVARLGSRSLTLFVDALDECDQSQAAGMVCFFEELCDHAKDMSVQLQICFSSRHYPTVVIEKGVEITLEHEVGHIDDIQQYIKSKLRLGKVKHAESLRSEILEKSSGIFLWVVLVLDILNVEYLNRSISISAIRSRLKDIPPGLDELFEMILARDGNNLEQLHVCLKWVLFATRPLKAQEFYFAVQLGLNRESSTYWDQEDIELDQMKMFVRTSTKGLAEVTRNKASEVQFIHESVRDFLFGRYGEQWSGPSGNFEGHNHNMLRDCCLAQLNTPIHQSVDLPDPLPQGADAVKLREDLNLKFPFLAYSVLSVLRHANSAQHHDMQQGDFLAAFPLPRWVTLNNAVQRHATRRYTKSVNLLYLLAENNLAELIRIHPCALSCFDVQGERYGPPIFAALATESNDAIDSFVELYLNTEPQESLLQSICKQYPKSKKCAKIGRTFTFPQKKHILSIIADQDSEWLLAFYSAVGWGTAREDDLRSPLSWAAEKGYRSLVTALLATKEFNVDSMENSGRTPLWCALLNRDETIVRLLIDNGADVEWEGDKGITPLSWASKNGHETMVRLLIDNGADLESKDTSRHTPLSWASINGHETVVRLLVDNGADVESKDIMGSTPLSHAAGKGHNAVVQLLIESANADVESKDTLGQTPLSHAADKGHNAVVQLLIESANADVESKDTLGRTPLSYAAARGQQGVVRLLLDTFRVEVDAKDSNGRTPLAAAAVGGHEDVVRLLLDNGADIDSKDADGHTPLLRAVKYLGIYTSGDNALMDYQMQLMLLEQQNKKRLTMARQEQDKSGVSEAGAVHANPFRFERRYKEEPTIKLLLERGADVVSVDNSGRTVLSYAVEKGSEAVVRLLLATRRVEVDAKDKSGRTPISRAIEKGHETIVKLLVNAGATVTSENKR